MGANVFFMRTTVELPPDLLRAAKARAAERGEALKALFVRAVSRELGRSRRAIVLQRERVRTPEMRQSPAPVAAARTRSRAVHDPQTGTCFPVSGPVGRRLR